MPAYVQLPQQAFGLQEKLYQARIALEEIMEFYVENSKHDVHSSRIQQLREQIKQESARYRKKFAERNS
jgi:hypothetical protein